MTCFDGVQALFNCVQVCLCPILVLAAHFQVAFSVLLT